MALAYALKKQKSTITAFQRRWRGYAVWKESYMVSRCRELEDVIKEYKRNWEKVSPNSIFRTNSIFRMFSF